MKKHIMLVVIGVVAWLLVAINENLYTREADVLSVESGVTAFLDEAGEIWEYETTSYPVGSQVKLRMTTHGSTDYIFDDEIVSISEN